MFVDVRLCVRECIVHVCLWFSEACIDACGFLKHVLMYLHVCLWFSEACIDVFW